MTGRIPVLDVQPQVACGEYPAKASVGEAITISATVFREGHDAVNASVALYRPDASLHTRVTMSPGQPGLDQWHAQVRPDSVGPWTFAVEGWSDPYATWHHNAEIKIPAGIDVELMLAEGAIVLDRAAAELPAGASQSKAVLVAAAASARDVARSDEARFHALASDDVVSILTVHPLREFVTPSASYRLSVEPVHALFSSWYEFFPRSEGAVVDPTGATPPKSGNFRTAMERIPAVAAMGFDVLYLPPIHPIGLAHRKGRNNTLDPGPDDVGVPWAIGSADGGHDAIHPDLGTMEDFDAFVARANELGIHVALDLALQASPDHPWVTEHPEWFNIRADGSIAYAENPPKKYQDIYPINFDNDFEGLVAEVGRIIRLWMAHGVRIFRVDNPHTKTVEFWHRIIGDINATDPDVIFLAEAFTRPAMMRALGMVGFQQSYSYFTWRNGADELRAYAEELRDSAAFMRPNFFVNTPDILPAFLQYGGPAAFKIRAVLASMLSPTWGVYAGYELYEHVALRPGGEEYLDSEKYQLRPRDWASYEPGGARHGQSLAPYLTRLNAIRRENPALQGMRNLVFHEADNPDVLVFSKREVIDGAENTVLVICSVDPHGPREATIKLNMPALGLDWHERFAAHDLMSNQSFDWGEYNFVRLDPGREPAHIVELKRWSA